MYNYIGSGKDLAFNKKNKEQEFTTIREYCKT